jgi:hypothetical protein
MKLSAAAIDFVNPTPKTSGLTWKTSGIAKKLVIVEFRIYI